MNAEGDHLRRRAHVERLLTAKSPSDETTDLTIRLEHLCQAAAQLFSAVGAAVSLMSDGNSVGVVAGADENSRALDELQFTLGEGPSRGAFTNRRPVLIADIETTEGDAWPMYRAALADRDVRGVFALPLHIGVSAFGVFTIYAGRSTSMSHSDLSLAVAFAEIATEIMLDGETVPFDGALHPGVESVLTYRAEVYQAQGFIAVTLDISLEESLVRLRAEAFQRGQKLVELSRSILSGETVLESGNDGP